MKRTLVTIAFLGGLLLVAASDASSQTKSGDPPPPGATDYGRPDKLSFKQMGFWVWYDDNGWNFHSTGGGKGHVFEGNIVIVGGKLDQDSIRGLNGDAKAGKKSDRYEFTPNKMVFKFNTSTKDDGVSFKVVGDTKELRFAVKVDGKEWPEAIRIGKDGAHPPRFEFAVPARPAVASAGGGSAKGERVEAPKVNTPPGKNPKKDKN